MKSLHNMKVDKKKKIIKKEVYEESKNLNKIKVQMNIDKIEL